MARLLPEQTRLEFVQTILPAPQASGGWLGQPLILDARGRELPASHVVIAHRDAQGGIERRSLVDAVLQPFQLTVGVGVQIGCSLGIALGTGDDAQPVQLPARVDQALCEAKRAGRGQVALAASGDGGSGAVA